MLFVRKLGSLWRSLLIRKMKESGSKKCVKRKVHNKTVGKLLKVLHPASKEMGNKVSIIGTGNVGMACAISLLARFVTHHICLFDKDANRLQGEMLDLQHGSIFIQDAKIESTTDLKSTEGSQVCIVCAGVNQKSGESFLNLLQRNTEVFKQVIPDLAKHSPNAILMIVTNPVDILTYIAWKLSGLPMYRVFGTGTNLDTARFRVKLGKKLGISPTNVHGYIIGEHGDNSVATWSGVSVAGTLLRSLNERLGDGDDPEGWGEIHTSVVRSPEEVIKYKGYTNWAIGLSVSDLTWACLGNTLRIHPVSTCVQGFHGIEDEVYLSLPCVMSSNGISKVVKQILTQSERDQLQNCAKLMKAVQAKIAL